MKLCPKHPELLGKRYASNRACVGCQQEEYKARRQTPEYKERERLRLLAWRERNRERARALARKSMAKWYENEENKKARVAQSIAYARAHPEKVLVEVRRRQTAKLRALPAWANSEWERFFAREVYHVARRRTLLTGVKHVVDHIYPLRAEWVCGLHCAANLQVLSEAENLRKHNKRVPSMEDNYAPTLCTWFA